MRQLIALIILGLSITLNVGAQSYKFDFTSGKKTKDGYIKITSADRYANAKGYGYDLSPSPDGKNHAPFFFSVAVPDGNYHVTAIIGSKRSAGETTLRGESRRLFYENVKTKKGELLPCSFTINKRDIHISDKEDVRTGVITYKIAAHAADLAKGHPGAQVRDNALSKARYEFRWKDQFDLSLDPERAQTYFRAGHHIDGEYCTMCGPNFCAMRLSRELGKKKE